MKSPTTALQEALGRLKVEQDGLSPLPQVEAKRERRRFFGFDVWCQLSLILSST